MNSGFENKHKEKVANGLASFLADSYTLYLKTQNFHWNVTGPRFPQLHAMFEEQYRELAEAVDEIAERIRALGAKSPGTFKEFSKLAGIDDFEGPFVSEKMVEDLKEGHEKAASKAAEVAQIASDSGDEASADLLISRIKTHEKTAWMLRSLMPQE